MPDEMCIRDRNTMEFIVTGHPAVVDRVVDQYRRAYQALGLFSPSQCRPDSFERLDYELSLIHISAS